jgi:hypothetical protein
VSLRPDIREAIVRAAVEHGRDPSIALAIAERESAFNPSAHASKTIAGLYQMTGGLRRQYGIGDSTDPYTQAKGWNTFFDDNKGEMARVLGRDVTDQEGYLGHHFGSTRAARMLKMDPNTPVDEVFSAYERSLNPHFDRAGTVGRLNSSVLADVDKRRARYGGASELPDFASFGSPLDAMSINSPSQAGGKIDMAPRDSVDLDFSSFGTPLDAKAGPKVASLEQPQPTPQPEPSAPAASSAPDLAQFGTPLV